MRLLRAVIACTGGTVAVAAALTLPTLAVITVAGVQLSYVVGARMKAQDVADSAALAGAAQLNADPIGAASRAKAFADSQLRAQGGQTTFKVSARSLGASSIQVTVDTYTPSFFGDLLPAGGFRSRAISVAEQQANSPLCIVSLGSGSDLLSVKDSSGLRGVCLVHSEGDLKVESSAAMTVERAEAVGEASGPITPAPRSGSLPIGDPFATLNLHFPSACKPSGKSDISSGVIPPGTHNEAMNFTAGANITMSPGIYYLCAPISLQANARLTGTGVTLVFASGTSIQMQSGAKISLSGSISGPLAGFAIATARDMTSPFSIPVDQFPVITGAVYSPGAPLVLTGSGTGAQNSAWTVVIAKAIQTQGSAILQINTNYLATTTPVPIGVGNKSGGAPVRLTG